MSETVVTFDFDRSRLNRNYDIERLQQEARRAVAHVPSFISYNIVPLTIAGKRNEEITDFSNPDWTEWNETPTLKESPYIQEILDSFECRKTNIRLMRLEAGGEIRLHRDPTLNLEFRNQLRLHVPIVMNDKVDFMLNDKRVPLREGELWYLKLDDLHEVHNNGSTERIQLSIDVVWNEWIENLILEGEKS